MRLFAQLSLRATTTTAAAAGASLSLSFTRAASSSAGAPVYYDAKIEDIRNVGIIAHVDAVSS
jgi:hypothetical protein